MSWLSSEPEASDLVGEPSSVSIVVAPAVEPAGPEFCIVGLVGQRVADGDQY